MSNKKCPKNSIEKFQKLFKSVPKTGKKVSQIRETITKWSQTAPDGRWGLKNGLFPWVFAGCCRGCLPFRNFSHIISFFLRRPLFSILWGLDVWTKKVVIVKSRNNIHLGSLCPPKQLKSFLWPQEPFFWNKNWNYVCESEVFSALVWYDLVNWLWSEYHIWDPRQTDFQKKIV